MPKPLPVHLPIVREAGAETGRVPLQWEAEATQAADQAARRAQGVAEEEEEDEALLLLLSLQRLLSPQLRLQKHWRRK